MSQLQSGGSLQQQQAPASISSLKATAPVQIAEAFSNVAIGISLQPQFTSPGTLTEPATISYQLFGTDQNGNNLPLGAVQFYQLPDALTAQDPNDAALFSAIASALQAWVTAKAVI